MKGKWRETECQRKDRAPELVPGTSRCTTLSASDSNNDFQAVATDKRCAGMLAARDDFAVFFNRDAFTHQIQRLDQLTQGKRGRQATEFAIDMKFNHKTLLLSGGREFQ